MSERERATFGAGCFWQAEATLRRFDGVQDTRVGYASEAGREEPLIEVVQVDFDPRRLAYPALVEAFWGLHDPTSRDRQGEHVGVKYRSVIFTHSPQQAEAAQEALSRQDGSGRFARPITTVILPVGRFEPADEEQQRYLEKNGLTSCSI
ncbi:peptide-methionine (S)-S-oxide reductase MsrA [Pseudomonas sp. CR3202]|uniref:peptide-methionine (S)-S-oxide reductase MsrA n=1 Tax=Pseudomonas sp. CR3202 TaxID=3351532 RepID=UPI003BF337C5